MFKRLLARLFGRKPKTAETKITVNVGLRGHEHIARELAKARSNQVNARRFGSGTTSSRRDDSSDLLNPLNPLSPFSPIHSHNHADWDSSSHRNHQSGHSWGGDSGSCDSGSSDSGSSSSGGCD